MVKQLNNIYGRTRIAMSKRIAIYVKNEDGCYNATIQFRDHEIEGIVHKISITADSIETLNQKIEMVYREDKMSSKQVQTAIRYAKFQRIKNCITNLFSNENVGDN